MNWPALPNTASLRMAEEIDANRRLTDEQWEAKKLKLTVNGRSSPGLKIANLADLKRATAIPGVAMRVIQHWQPQLVGTTRMPKAARKNGRPGVQTNGYWFDGPNRENKIVEMWSDFPRAAQLAFYGDDRVTFYPDSERCWTLQFVPPEGWNNI